MFDRSASHMTSNEVECAAKGPTIIHFESIEGIDRALEQMPDFVSSNAC